MLIQVKPIGYVHSSVENGDIKRDRWNTVSEIIILKKYSKGLEGIEGFSHVHVIYWPHKLQRKLSMKVYPLGRTDMPKIGLFATRNPQRPNPICLSLVDLVERAENVLKVKGLDAYNGSPVLDLKPYDLYDRPEKIKVAEWWLSLHRQKR